MTAEDALSDLHGQADPEKAKGMARYFKTGPGQYGEGDTFIGIAVPNLRQTAKRFKDLPLKEAETLLQNPIHEARSLALYVLAAQYGKGTSEERQAIFDCYLANTRYINNWDLVDSSAEYIVGPQLGEDKSLLRRLAASESLWERRIAMLSCFHYIKSGSSVTAFEVIEILQTDRHDLIQKAIGWMLREIGKRCSRSELETWLREQGRYKTLPRTALRYAIEHFSPEERAEYLKGTV